MKQLKKLVLLGLTAISLASAVIPAEAATLSEQYGYKGLQTYSYATLQNILAQLSKQPAAGSTTKPAPAPAPAPAPTPAPTPTPAPAPNNTGVSLTAPLTAQEQQMVNLVNQERAKQGLPALQVDMRLVKVARMKSLDMIQNNYFGHQSPTYGSPSDLMKSQGITYKYAGENIAGNGTVENAHQSLMNSPGHRANILDPRFTKIGIGIIKGGPYGLMISQEFNG